MKYWLGVKIAKARIVSLFHHMSGPLFTCFGSHKLSCTATLSCIYAGFILLNVLKLGAVFGTMQKLWKISLLFDVSQASE